MAPTWINRSDIPTDVKEEAITDVKQLASYNWIEASEPTIVVPGMPPRWSPPEHAPSLSRDANRLSYRDNEKYSPDSPLEPPLRALYAANPSFDITSVNIVTVSSAMHRLLVFVNKHITAGTIWRYTINIEIIGNTAIIYLPPADPSKTSYEALAYGSEFRKAYTMNQIEGSLSHHRVISYRFGGLSFVVGYEADGYVDSKHPNSDTTSSMLETYSLPSITRPGSTLRVKKQVEQVPLESIIQIKTNPDKCARLRYLKCDFWIRQTHKAARPAHTEGTFSCVEVEDTKGVIEGWQLKNGRELGRFAELIKMLCNEAKLRGGYANVAYVKEKDALRIEGVGEPRKKMLPEYLYSKWGLGGGLGGGQEEVEVKKRLKSRRTLGQMILLS